MTYQDGEDRRPARVADIVSRKDHTLILTVYGRNGHDRVLHGVQFDPDLTPDPEIPNRGFWSHRPLKPLRPLRD